MKDWYLSVKEREEIAKELLNLNSYIVDTARYVNGTFMIDMSDVTSKIRHIAAACMHIDQCYNEEDDRR